MTNPAIDRTNVVTGKIVKRNRCACTRRHGPTTEAQNDREGFFSRARDRFTVTSYVSALHIPGPCPETIWIPNTSYHNRRFKVPGGRWSRIQNYRTRLAAGGASELREIENQIHPWLSLQLSANGRPDPSLKSGPTLFELPRPTPFFDKRDLLTFLPTGNPRGMYVKNKYQRS